MYVCSTRFISGWNLSDYPSSTLCIWAERVQEAHQIARTFVDDIYYPCYDAKKGRSRKQLGNIYSPAATITWRGHRFKSEAIGNFIDNLPETEHRVDGYDAHPLAGAFALNPIDHDAAPMTCQISVAGSVSYKNVSQEGEAPKPVDSRDRRSGRDERPRRPQVVLQFNHHFVLVAARDATTGKPSWKIISEVMRLHDKWVLNNL